MSTMIIPNLLYHTLLPKTIHVGDELPAEEFHGYKPPSIRLNKHYYIHNAYVNFFIKKPAYILSHKGLPVMGSVVKFS